MNKVKYGGSDGSCKHIEFDGKVLGCLELLKALKEAEKTGIKKVCIRSIQFEPLIRDLEFHMGP